jgi:hypothetical protein
VSEPSSPEAAILTTPHEATARTNPRRAALVVPAIVSPRWDLVWFVGPGVVSLLLALALAVWPPAVSSALRDEWIWITCVLAIDVAHVWASLHRTYLDGTAWEHHRARMLWTPALLLWFGALVHIVSPALFWRALAYVAVFHFIKQHEGFAMLYLRAGEPHAGRGSARPALAPARARWLVKLAMWSGTVGPIVAWHATLPRHFAWFVEGDFVPGVPAIAGPLAMGVAGVAVGAFLVWRIAEWRRGATNPLLTAVVVLPAINWTTGMVIFDDDAIFTVTNVIMHGVPYLALVWRTGGEETISRWIHPERGDDITSEVRRRDTPRRTSLAPSPWVLATVFYVLLLALAITEEALWDRWIWHDRAWLFGEASRGSAARHPVATSVLVALLTLPQATHYVLDRYIWRVGPLNPRLAGQLGFAPPTASPPPTP